MDLLYMDLPGKEGFVWKIQLSLTKKHVYQGNDSTEQPRVIFSTVTLYW